MNDKIDRKMNKYINELIDNKYNNLKINYILKAA